MDHTDYFYYYEYTSGGSIFFIIKNFAISLQNHLRCFLFNRHFFSPANLCFLDQHIW